MSTLDDDVKREARNLRRKRMRQYSIWLYSSFGGLLVISVVLYTLADTHAIAALVTYNSLLDHLVHSLAFSCVGLLCLILGMERAFEFDNIDKTLEEQNRVLEKQILHFEDSKKSTEMHSGQLSEIYSLLEKIETETKTLSKKGFKKYDKKSAFQLAAKVILEAKDSIKVMGYAKSTGIKKHDDAIQAYLQATIKKLEEDPIEYHRICPCNCATSFQEHLRDCIRSPLTNGSKSKVNLIMLTGFDPPYTCLIVDHDFFMLTLNHPFNSDLEYSLITEDTDMIQNLINHFNLLWSEYENIFGTIVSLDQFNETMTKYSKIDKSLMNISSSYLKNRTLGRMSAYIEAAYIELSNYLANIGNHKIEIHHTKSISSLLTAFSIFIDKMTAKDTYYVVTTLGIWRKVMHEDRRERDFERANAEAINRNVPIKRCLILDYNLIFKEETLIESDEFTVSLYYQRHLIRKILKQHIEWVAADKDYDFKILFLDEYEKKKNELQFFSLIHYENGDSILFTPEKENDVVAKTIIEFNSKIAANQKKFYEKLVDKINNDQHLGKTHIEFIKGINPGFFKNKENLKKVIGNNYNKSTL